MMNYIVTLCGTSCITNGADQEMRRLCNQYSNADSPVSIPDEYRQQITEHLHSRRDSMLRMEIGEAKRASAEINALMHFYHDQPQRGKPDQHILLHTDTWLGQEAADTVKLWLQQLGLCVETQTFEGLRTDSMLHFRRALADIAHWCAQSLPESGYHIVFNLTGGFKSIQGFMQTLGAFYAHERIYIFESGEELLRIPRLPVYLDALNEVRGCLEGFRRLALGLDAAHSSVPELYRLEIDGEACLSDWGALVWNQSRATLYKEDILPPLTDTYRFSASVKSDVDGLSPDRKRIVNERMDELARYFDDKINPGSLNFKRLKGDPHPPCTHELYAWSDQDAKRIFGYFDENDCFVIERLGKHL